MFVFLTVPTTEQILDRFLYDLKVSLRVESPVSNTKILWLIFYLVTYGHFLTVYLMTL